MFGKNKKERYLGYVELLGEEISDGVIKNTVEDALKQAEKFMDYILKLPHKTKNDFITFTGFTIDHDPENYSINEDERIKFKIKYSAIKKIQTGVKWY